MDPKFFRKYADLISEAEQLNEYIVEVGEPVTTLLDSLHIFHIDDFDHDPNFVNNQEWQKLVAQWKPVAAKLANGLKKAAKQGKTLNQEEVNDINEVYHYGEDGFDVPSVALDLMPKIWDKELEVASYVLNNFHSENNKYITWEQAKTVLDRQMTLWGFIKNDSPKGTIWNKRIESNNGPVDLMLWAKQYNPQFFEWQTAFAVNGKRQDYPGRDDMGDHEPLTVEAVAEVLDRCRKAFHLKSK